MVGLLLCISFCGLCLSHLNYWQLNKAKIKLHCDVGAHLEFLFFYFSIDIVLQQHGMRANSNPFEHHRWSTRFRKKKKKKPSPPSFLTPNAPSQTQNPTTAQPNHHSPSAGKSKLNKNPLPCFSSHQITVTHQPHNPSQTENPPIRKSSVKTQPQCPATLPPLPKNNHKKGPSPKSSAPSKSPTTQEVTKLDLLKKNRTFNQPDSY